MQITYRADAMLAEVNIEGVDFARGETKEVGDAELAALILRNPNFVDENGRNAYSDPLPASAPATAPVADPKPSRTPVKADAPAPAPASAPPPSEPDAPPAQ